jgi:hypothetical protein
LKEAIDRLDKRADERSERELETAAKLSAAVAALSEMTRRAGEKASMRPKLSLLTGVPGAAVSRRLRERLSDLWNKVVPSSRRHMDEKGRGP